MKQFDTYKSAISEASQSIMNGMKEVKKDFRLMIKQLPANEWHY